MQKTLQTLLICLILAGTAFAGEKKGDRQQDAYSKLLDSPVSVAWDNEERKIYVAQLGIWGSLPVIEKEKDEVLSSFEERIIVIDMPNKRFGFTDIKYLPNLYIKAPGGLAFNDDTLFIVDSYNDRVLKYDLLNEVLIDSILFLVDPDTNGLFPSDICMDDNGTLYVLDRIEETVYSKGTSSQTFTEMNLQGESLAEPSYMYYDSEYSRILITSYADSNAVIYGLNLDSNYVSVVKQTELSELTGITKDSSGYYHVASQQTRYSYAGGDVYTINPDFSGDLVPWYTNRKDVHAIMCIPGRDSILITVGGSGYVGVEPIMHEVPVATYPLDDATGIENELEFSWTPVSQALYYELQVSTSSTFSWDHESLISRNLHNNLLVESLEYDTEYFWRVRAKTSPNIYTDWSETNSFSTSSTFSEGPDLTYPISSTTGLGHEITFQWDSVTGAESYRVAISKDQDFDQLYFEENSATNNITLKYFDLDTTYFWKVKASGGSVGTCWSESSTFTTIEPTLDLPVLTYPENYDGGLPMYLELIWDTVPNANYYLLQVDDGFEYDPLEAWGTFISDTTSNEYYSLDGVEAEGYFKCRIKAFNDDSTSSWSSIYYFSTCDTNLTPPGAIAPAENEEPSPVNPTFNWTNMNVDNYDIQIALLGDSVNIKSNFIKPDIEQSNIEDTLFTLNTDLQKNTQYLWRVRSKITDRASSAWSEPAEFITMNNTKVTDMTTSGLNLQVIPNPVNRNAVIRLENAGRADVVLSLYDALGKEIRVVYSGRPQPGAFDLDLNTDNLNSGIYYLTLRQGDLSISRKVIITK